MKSAINILWFKRDLRLKDHLPFKTAIEDDLPILLIYILEPSLISAQYSDERHWRFIVESIKDLNEQLKRYSQQVYMFYCEAIPLFEKLLSYYEIKNVFSHRETGTWLTYQRDIEVNKFFKARGIKWKEFQSNAVIRGLKNRDSWNEKRNVYLSMPLANPQLEKLKPFNIENEIFIFFNPQNFISSLNSNQQMQKGGEKEAEKVLNSFLKERHVGYIKNISLPEQSRIHCSRLSPYLAWGNLSIRQVEQLTNKLLKKTSSKRDLLAFQSRVAWHCHFIQKLETEPEYEFRNINSAFDHIRTEWNETHYQAWKDGLTGYPLIDACMRCVKETGYINFRMRAMLVSFLTHHLWLDWKEGANFLAKQFLDFEPGIHFPQFQMQAGTTGINTIRIYNPTKQALEHDNNAVFIKRWVPELATLPSSLAIEPWKITPFEEVSYNFIYGKNYPKRIVDTEITYRRANKILWQIKKSTASRIESEKILDKHVKSV
ncbi:MAG: deoxyribodipyrimidine photo-lyase [Ignavibacterium sp.]|jgi:deoxyribodipyrimidine photo-lyase|uniref:cryptochrome/deoxyribodipyrimidine photo-lyase family protein n=1 Tax=Ignavibacterium sp. TaxID=2651167 RepID=UPI0032976068